MTDPLIGPDALFDVIETAKWRSGCSSDVAARDVLAYLRGALTPEALNPNGAALVPAIDLHRRIFGEGK